MPGQRRGLESNARPKKGLRVQCQAKGGALSPMPGQRRGFESNARTKEGLRVQCEDKGNKKAGLEPNMRKDVGLSPI